jgi:hypothetical protein
MPIVDYKSALRCFIHELSKLLNRPLGSRMVRNTDGDQLPPRTDLHCDEYIKDTEPSRDGDKEVAGYNCLGVIVNKRRPTLIFRSRPNGSVLHISGDGIVNLRNLLAVSQPRTTANLLICGRGVGRACLKIVEIWLNLTMPATPSKDDRFFVQTMGSTSDEPH